MEKGRREGELWRYLIGAAISAAAVSGAFWLLSVGLLELLYPLAENLTKNDAILRALETLQNATVWPPLWWTIPAGVFLFGAGLFLRRAWRCGPRRRLHAALWGIAILMFVSIAFLISLWMTRVNNIPVHTMTSLLWRYLSTGGLSV